MGRSSPKHGNHGACLPLAADMNDTLQSKQDVVLVTGGSRGIGASIVEGCLMAGFAVCFTYTQDEEGASALISKLGVGLNLAALRADVVDSASMEAAFDLADSLGHVRALVNNAGVTGTISNFQDTSLDQIRRVIDINLYGPILASRLAVRRWLPCPAGRSIVNVSSAAATLGSPHEYIPYAATKAGVETLTLGLAKELGPTGIRVNAVSPGVVETSIHSLAGKPDRLESVVGRIPMGRIGQPSEIAEAVTWLISNRASYVTGAVLRVSGGL